MSHIRKFSFITWSFFKSWSTKEDILVSTSSVQIYMKFSFLDLSVNNWTNVKHQLNHYHFSWQHPYLRVPVCVACVSTAAACSELVHLTHTDQIERDLLQRSAQLLLSLPHCLFLFSLLLSPLVVFFFFFTSKTTPLFLWHCLYIDDVASCHISTIFIYIL